MSQVETLRKWRDETASEARYTTAAVIGDKIVTMTGSSDDAFAFAKILYDQAKYLRAASVLEKHVDDMKCRRLAARSLVRAEKLDEALELVQESDAQLQFLEGEIWSAKSSFENAKLAYIRALKLDTRCFEAFDMLVSRKLLTQQEERQLTTQQLDFTGALGGDCADFAKSIYLSRLSGSISSVDIAANAITNLNEVYELQQNTDIMAHQCELLYTQSNFSKCRDTCEELFARDPYNYTPYPAYAGSLYELGDHKALFKIGHKLAEESPQSAMTWYIIGVYYLQIANHAEARRNFSKATMLDPFFASAWLGFAHTFSSEGEHERAITAYATASRLFPGSHFSYMFLGMQYLYLNNLNLASEYLLKSGELCGYNDPLLLNELAVLNYHRNDLDQATAYIERSFELAGTLNCDLKTWSPIKANMGYVHRRRGNHREALEVFEEVSRHCPDDANIAVGLGLANLNLGNRDAAIFHFNNALGIKRSDSVATDMLRTAMEVIEPIESILAGAGITFE